MSVRHYFVRLTANDWGKLRDLQRVHDLDVFARTARQRSHAEFEIEGLLSEDQIAEARSLGYGVDVLRDAEDVGRQRQAEVAEPHDREKEENEP